MTWLSRAEQARRNAHVMELWAMGYSRREIAEWVDITPQRVSQVVNGFGAGWRDRRADAGVSRGGDAEDNSP